jgi:hypothetical protein
MEVRIDNVSELLAAIGCKGEHEKRGQGWHRVFIHAPQKDSDIPLSLGRVMFHNGEFYGVKWYGSLTGFIQEHDWYYFRWIVYVNTGKFLGVQSWERLKKLAFEKAKADFAERKAKRLELNATRIAQGKKPRTRAFHPLNPRKAAREIAWAWINKEVGREVIPHCY